MVHFARKKCKSFHGRKEFLEASKNVLVNHENQAVVLHGESGCGKTSIMAKIVSEVKQWLEDDSAIVVLRFIGTTPESSGIRPLLRSICVQLCRATDQNTTDIPEVWFAIIVPITGRVEKIIDVSIRMNESSVNSVIYRYISRG